MNRFLTEFNRRGFTLIELLVVIAIVAVIGTGVAVTYGRETVERARRQMTIHEAGQLRSAFQRFHADNAPRLLQGVHEPNASALFPSSDFIATFSEKPDSDDRTYGMLEFYERYGLWALLQPAVAANGERLDDSDFVYFGDADPLTGEGWQGPYADAATRVACVANGDYGDLIATTDTSDPIFPQVGTRFDDGFFHVVYFEHCEDESDTSEPIYRRLLLVAAEDPTAWDEFTKDKLGALTGNRRLGGNSTLGLAASYPLDVDTGAIQTRDTSNGLYITELLNLDLWRQP